MADYGTHTTMRHYQSRESAEHRAALLVQDTGTIYPTPNSVRIDVSDLITWPTP